MSYKTLAGLCLLLCTASLPMANAAPASSESTADPDSARTLSLRSGIQRLLASNPELRAYPLRQRVLQEESQSAALAPPLNASLNAENILGTGDASGLDVAEFTLALSGVVELGEQASSRVNVLARRGDVVEAERRAAELDLLADLARQHVQLAAQQHRTTVATEQVALTRSTAEAIERRVQRGRTPEAELARARAAAARANLELSHLRHQLPTMRVGMAALWGELEPDFDRVEDAALLQPGRAGRFAPLQAALEGNPNLARFNNLARLREAELHLAESDGRPDIQWTAGIRRLEGIDSTALVAGLSVPLFGERRNRPAVEAARLRAEIVGYDREAAFIRSRALLFRLYENRVHAIEELKALGSDVIPQLDAALADIREGYARGRYGYVELSTARRELIEARLAQIDAAERAQLARIELERLTGSPLLTGVDTHNTDSEQEPETGEASHAH